MLSNIRALLKDDRNQTFALASSRKSEQIFWEQRQHVTPCFHLPSLLYGTKLESVWRLWDGLVWHFNLILTITKSSNWSVNLIITHCVKSGLILKGGSSRGRDREIIFSSCSLTVYVSSPGECRLYSAKSLLSLPSTLNVRDSYLTGMFPVLSKEIKTSKW